MFYEHRFRVDNQGQDNSSNGHNSSSSNNNSLRLHSFPDLIRTFSHRWLQLQMVDFLPMLLLQVLQDTYDHHPFHLS